MESFGLSIKDLETDFDPEAYDDVMQTVFNDNYYHTGEKEDKPEFSDMEGEFMASLSCTHRPEFSYTWKMSS